MTFGLVLYVLFGLAVLSMLDGWCYSLALRRLRRCPARFWCFIPGSGFYLYVRSHSETGAEHG